MMLDIGRRYGIELGGVPMVGDTLRDLVAAQAAGCEPHLVTSGRAAALSDDELRAMAGQVPGTTIHASLGAFVDHLLQREHVPDSESGGLG
jgi:D-glycero-D-manno-heptose 1,7-bisphosphate phosphatase